MNNLRAFARLYGYVRFFHPSDEAAAIDWEAFAVHGVRRVRDASGDELVALLRSLFGPVASTMRLFRTGERPPSDVPLPDETEGLRVVAWQHKGIEFDSRYDAYRSVRLNREPERGPRDVGRLSMAVESTELRGREVRLVGVARVDDEEGQGRVDFQLRVNRPDLRDDVIETTHGRSISRPDWTSREVTAAVPEDATRLWVSGFLSGAGRAHFDRFDLEVRNDDGEWEAVALSNNDFAESEVGCGAPADWSPGGKSYRFDVTDLDDGRGKVALIESLPHGPLFDERPSPDDPIELEIGAGLSVRMPLALYTRDGRTLGSREDGSFDELQEALDAVELRNLTCEDVDVGLAAVVVAWNVAQHFYPYLDVIETDWESLLPRALDETLDSESAEEFVDVTQRLVADLHDGHARVWFPPSPSSTHAAGLPLLLEVVDDEIIVVATGEGCDGIHVGDVLRAVDGVPAMEALVAAENRASGSPQWKRRRGLRALGGGPHGSEATLRLERGFETSAVRVARTGNHDLSEPRPAPLVELREGVYYINLCEVEYAWSDIPLDELSVADAIVFDLRGYPNAFTERFLGHLTETELHCAQWHVPLAIYPDQKRRVGWDDGGRWVVEPREPRFRGRSVFLTDANAISYAETIMGIVEHYALGPIVGQPTAGTNGNINACFLPGNGRLSFTGMKVLKHDGAQHHLVGIQPTHHVDRTRTAILAGRDEVLEVALDLIGTAGE